MAETTDTPADTPPVVRALSFVDHGIARLEEVVLAISLLGLLVVGVYETIKLHFIGHCPAWPNEVIRYFVFAIGLFGAATAAQSDRLFNIDMMTRLAGKRGKLVIRVVTALFTVYACGVFARGCFTFKKISLTGESYEGAIKPVYAVYILVAALALIAIHMTIHAAIDLYYLVTNQLPQESLVVHGTAIDQSDSIDGLTEHEHMRAWAACPKCGTTDAPRPMRELLVPLVVANFGGLLFALMELKKSFVLVAAGVAVFVLAGVALVLLKFHRCTKCGEVRR